VKGRAGDISGAAFSLLPPLQSGGTAAPLVANRSPISFVQQSSVTDSDASSYD
jgi:hypothetical protein